MRNLHSGDKERKERHLKKNLLCFVRQEKRKGEGESWGAVIIYILNCINI